jgi:hypothetical protein
MSDESEKALLEELAILRIGLEIARRKYAELSTKYYELMTKHDELVDKYIERADNDTT